MPIIMLLAKILVISCATAATIHIPSSQYAGGQLSSIEMAIMDAAHGDLILVSAHTRGGRHTRPSPSCPCLAPPLPGGALVGGLLLPAERALACTY